MSDTTEEGEMERILRAINDFSTAMQEALLPAFVAMMDLWNSLPDETREYLSKLSEEQDNDDTL